jgi:translation initiation factor IF-2
MRDMAWATGHYTGATPDGRLKGQPVSISGVNQVPEAGDPFIVVDQLDTARKVAQERGAQLRKQRLKGRQRVTLENLYESIERGEAKQLNVILKADVQGTLDPLVKTISEIGTQEASLKIIHSGVGNISSSDVLLAEASDAIILAFRVHEDEKVREMALAHGVEVLHYDVIYDVTDHIRAALEGLLEPERREERVGRAEVRQLFYSSRYGTIAGCYVAEGAIRRNCRVRVHRAGKMLFEGNISSLRQGKNDVREVEAGRECGINVEGFNSFEVSDVIECFNVVAVKRTLTPSGAGESARADGRAYPSPG